MTRKRPAVLMQMARTKAAVWLCLACTTTRKPPATGSPKALMSKLFCAGLMYTSTSPASKVVISAVLLLP